MNRTITALYASRTEAERAADQLRSLGVTSVDVVDESARGATSTTSTSGDGKGIWESIKDFFSGDDATTYDEGVRRGRSLLVVRGVDDAQGDRIVEALERTDALDVDEETRSYRETGWTGQTAGAATGYAASGSTERLDTRDLGEERIPVVEEQLAVGKRDTVRGGARIRSYVREVPVHEQVSLREEHVHVERRPVNETLSTADATDLLRDREIEVTEHAEEAVVGKRAVVTEEVVVGKDVRERTETVQDSVRRTEVEVDDLGDDRLERTTTTDYNRR